MSDFDQFWAQYPRRVAKGAARKAWDKAMKREPELLAKCLSALAWQVRVNEWDGGSYTPHPATYLNQERYDDENPRAAIEAERERFEAEEREFQARRKARIDAESQVYEFQRRRA